MKIPSSLFFCSFCQIKTLCYFQHRMIISAKAHARAWSFFPNPHIPTHIFFNFVFIHWFFLSSRLILFTSGVCFGISFLVFRWLQCFSWNETHSSCYSLSRALLPKYDLFFIYRMILIVFVDHFYFDLSRNKSMHEDDHRGIVTMSGGSAERPTHVSFCSLHTIDFALQQGKTW